MCCTIMCAQVEVQTLRHDARFFVRDRTVAIIVETLRQRMRGLKGVSFRGESGWLQWGNSRDVLGVTLIPDRANETVRVSMGRKLPAVPPTTNGFCNDCQLGSQPGKDRTKKHLVKRSAHTESSLCNRSSPMRIFGETVRFLWTPSWSLEVWYFSGSPNTS